MPADHGGAGLMGTEPSDGEIAYWAYSCFCDEASCEACLRLDGTCWLPDFPNPPDFPKPPRFQSGQCTSPEGCRCMPVGFPVNGGYHQEYEPLTRTFRTLEEPDNPRAVAEFLRSVGGIATGEQVKVFRESVKNKPS